MQDGDVYQTFADIGDLKEVTGYIPKIKINEGIQEFVNWYKAYFKK